MNDFFGMISQMMQTQMQIQAMQAQQQAQIQQLMMHQHAMGMVTQTLQHCMADYGRHALPANTKQW